MPSTPDPIVSPVSDCNGSEGYEDTAEGVEAQHEPHTLAERIQAWEVGDTVLIDGAIYDVLAKSDNGGAYLGYCRAGVSDVRLYVK